LTREPGPDMGIRFAEAAAADTPAATDQSVVCVVGLGYVGLPLAKAFSKSLRVIGVDTDHFKVDRLNHEDNGQGLVLTHDATRIREADFVIIAVPTPVTRSKQPDLSCVENAGRAVAHNLKRGSVVILESTVYPGVTEEILVPILEESGLLCGSGFKIAYSPERINPGDADHELGRITKVVAGMDEETTEAVAALYRRVTPNVYKAKDIKTAEAAKVIENIQRDLNIALMNELSLIFDKMGLSTREVLDAAATKWNFHRYSPGLVGGHCIPVDPYYLVYKAKELGYHPQVILAGRAINDSMPKHVAQMTIKALNKAGKVIRRCRVLIMGLAYKEDVADTRETPVSELSRELQEYGVEVFGYDPLLHDIGSELGVTPVQDLSQVSHLDCIILAVAHRAFRNMTVDQLKRMMNTDPALIDVRGVFDEKDVLGKGVAYYTL